jgi:glycosyltransferase involved in cell wall biosynthesis
MTPLVSVVIPAYRSARTLPTAVNSVLRQTATDLEVIIVDDGSTDGTLAVAQSISDPRVAVISQPNGGAAAARNTGIAAARGEWVALLDADDIWLPEKLERQLATLAANPHVSAVQCGVFRVNDEMQLLEIDPCRETDDSLDDFLNFRNMPGMMSTLVIRRAKFEEMGGFDTDLEILEEWDMTIKTARYCAVVNMPDLLALYRVHPGNRSRDLEIHIGPGFTVLRRLFDDPDLPDHIRARERHIYARFYTMLCGGAFKVRRWRACAGWGARALQTDPRMAAYMAALPARQVQRWFERRNGRRLGSLAEEHRSFRRAIESISPMT